MKKGKWFLTYVAFDNMENYNPWVSVKRELLSSDEDNAIVEATDVWKLRIEKKYVGYDKQTYPREPKVIYEIEL